MAQRLRRDQVPTAETWNLADIYPTPAAWAADAAKIDPELQEVAAFRGRVSESAASLLACLYTYDRVITRLHRLRRYAYFDLAVDGTASQGQALSAEGEALAARVEAECSFLKPEIVSLSPATLEHYLQQEPGLGAFRPLLEEALRERTHLLPLETEAVLGAFSAGRQAPQQHWNMATAVDLRCDSIVDASGERLPVSIASYGSVHAQSPERTVRRAAFESLVAGLDGLKATLATSLSTHITQNVVMAKVRGYSSAIEMLLARQQVPQAVYDQVLDVVHDEIAPHVRRLMLLRGRVLGLEHLHRYDIEAPLDPEFQPVTTFAESAVLIQDVLHLFGEEYGEIITAAFRDRWIDRADNLGKRSGAFCWPVAGIHPYVFISWKDTLRSAFTLAHELGHGAHYEMTLRRHPLSSFSQDSATLLVEAPSTANELLLARHLLRTTTEPRLRRWLVLQSLSTFIHNMVTHMLEGRFERRLYALAQSGKPLTVDTIRGVQGEVFEQFYAGTVTVDDGARLYWTQQPHFYMNLFPYAYAAGLAVSYSAVTAMEDEGQPAVSRWVDMLKLGTTVPPLALAKHAGVDLADPETLRRAVRYFGSLVDELEASFAR